MDMAAGLQAQITTSIWGSSCRSLGFHAIKFIRIYLQAWMPPSS